MTEEEGEDVRLRLLSNGWTWLEVWHKVLKRWTTYRELVREHREITNHRCELCEAVLTDCSKCPASWDRMCNFYLSEECLYWKFDYAMHSHEWKKAEQYATQIIEWIEGKKKQCEEDQK